MRVLVVTVRSSQSDHWHAVLEIDGQIVDGLSQYAQKRADYGSIKMDLSPVEYDDRVMVLARSGR